jgi:hypothetical protein
MNVFPPRRRRHSYTQTLAASPAAVFPLLCPVREADWTPGWEPLVVLSASGVAERDCVFITSGLPHVAIWTITRYDAEAYRLEFLKVTPEHSVCKIEIALSAIDTDGTAAEIAYSYTSLGPAGDAFLAEFTEEWYGRFMREWEDALNHYLATGRMIGTD